jgi:hypothetical protein
MRANASSDRPIRLYCLGYSRDADAPGDAGEARQADLHAALAHADALVDRDPDVAALLLDGLLLRGGAESSDNE